MRAAILHKHGGKESLSIDEIPEPECMPGKIKINILASAINHLDIWVRKGFSGIKLPLPMILGSDGSGTIIETNGDVGLWKIGDEVVIQPGIFCNKCSYCVAGNENYCKEYGILGETTDGVQAEYIIVDPVNIYAKPNHLTFVEASSMQLVFMTAYHMLIKRAKVQKNETVLVYGGTSGIGSAAIQICSSAGAHVIATVGSHDKIKHAENMGADNVIVHSDKNWPEAVNSITDKGGVDIVFEHVGRATWEKSLRVLAKGGRIVTCGATSGDNVQINLTHLFIKQHSILGSTMSDLATFNEVMRKIHNREYFPFVDKIFKIQNIRNAHEYVENSQHKGKIVMEFN